MDGELLEVDWLWEALEGEREDVIRVDGSVISRVAMTTLREAPSSFQGSSTTIQQNISKLMLTHLFYTLNDR